MRTYLAVLLIMAICLTYALLTALMPRDVFWITDGGNKFITMENIIRDRTDAVAYPAADIDTEYKFFPYSNFHFVRHHDNIYSIFPPYFSAFSSFFYRAAGYWGLYLISILSTGIVLLLTLRIIQRLKLPDKYLLSLPVLGLCTPFFFYSLTFWEMTLTAMLTTTAVLMVVRRTENNTTIPEFLLAGLMMGSAIILREDIYVLAAALVAAMFILKYKKTNIAITCAGTMIIVISLWSIQYAKYGHILGLHGSKYYAHNLDGNENSVISFIVNQLNGYYTYLLKFNSGDFADKWYYFLLAIPFIMAVWAGIKYKNPAERTAAFVTMLLAVISSAILTVMLFNNNQPVLNTIFTVGFLTSSPLLVPLLLSMRSFFSSRLRRIKLILLTSVIYCIVIAPLLTQSDMGIIWGPRHFIYLFPLLIPLCIYAMIRLFYRSENRQLALKLAGLGILLLAISLLIQVKGVANLFLMKNNVAMMNNHLENANEVIVSDIYWLPAENPRLFYNKKFMQVNSGQELEKFVELMKRNNVRTFTLVLAKDINYRRITNDDIKRLLTKISIDKPVALDLPGTDFLSIITVSCRLKSSPLVLSE
ncbi:MAG: hypothetical protein WCV67_13110 [Victivallaceae bacterium]|jgi:hypothetical protein